MHLPGHDGLLETLKLTGLIGIVVAVFRHVIEDRHGGWSNFLKGAASSIVVAVIVGFLLGDTTLQELTRAAIIGITAYIADDIITGTRKITASLRNDPLQAIKEVLNIWRGR